MQAKGGGGYSLNYMPPVLYDARGNGSGDVAAAITGDHENRITDYTNIVCCQNTGHGWWNEGDVAQTLRTPCGGDASKANLVIATGQANAEIMEGCSPTLNAAHEQPILVRDEVPPTMPTRRYIVRRLTPLECCRLQGFPDWWTVGIAVPNPTEEDIAFWTEVWETHRKAVNPKSKPKTRKQIIKWIKNPGSDSNEYKMWGNGMALPCMFAVASAIQSIETEAGDT